MSRASTISKEKRRKGTARKRLPKREEAADETEYKIRSIVGEKVQDNTRWFLIDWAPNSQTGESYPQSWEPEPHVNLVAFFDWEEEKRRRYLGSGSNSEPEQPSNHGKRRRQSEIPGGSADRPSKKYRTLGSSIGEPVEQDWRFVESLPDNRRETFLELHPQPDFDPDEYIAISLSQPSQPSQVPSETLLRGKISQTTTIPDSQEITDSLQSQSAPDPLLRSPSSPVPAQLDITDSRVGSVGLPPEVQSSEGPDRIIPSRQPDSLHPPSQHLTDPLVEHDTALPGPENPSRAKQGGFGSEPSSGGFLAQIESDPLATSPETSFPEVVAVDTSATVSVQINSETGCEHGTALPQSTQSLQPAQFVVPLSSSQTEDLIESIESNIVPDTVLKPARKKSTGRPNPRPDTPASASLPRSDSLSHPEVLDSASSMDHQPPDNPPRGSAADVFRKLRASILEDTDSRPALPANLTPPAVQPLEQPIISPSSILPVADNNGSPPPPHDQVNPSDMWHGTSAGISLRALDMTLAPKPSQATSVQDPHSPVTQGLGGDVSLDFALDHAASMHIPPPGHFLSEHDQRPEIPHIPATVAPSDLTNAPANLLALTADPMHGHHQGLGEHVEHVEPLLPGPDYDQYHADTDSEERLHGLHGHYTVTLPMAANTRPEYLTRLSGNNKQIMCEFAQGFADSLEWVPDNELLAKVDNIFQELLDLCDLPTYVDDMPELDSKSRWKHATGTNSKFSFIYEFLKDIRDLNLRVLILCRSGYAFQYLEALLAAPGFIYSILGQESEDNVANGLAVILGAADRHPPVVHGGVDIVITFDHLARATDLSQVVSEPAGPLVLDLVVSYSIEHIDIQLTAEVEGLERKNALNLALDSARDLVRSPERSLDPHEIAIIFASFVRNPGAEIDWEPQSLPEGIFDVWLTSQTKSQEQLLTDPGAANALNNKKRRLDDDEVGTPKRARIVDSPRPPRNNVQARMSDLLKRTLAAFAVAGGATLPSVELPMYQLESMAAKILDLENQLSQHTSLEATYHKKIKSLESYVESYERTVRMIQPKYMEALRDRGTFEKKYEEAVAEASIIKTTIKDKLQKKLEEREQEIANLKDQNRTLETKLADLSSTFSESTAPDVAKLATAEKDLLEAKAKIESFEKKVANTESEMEYTRSAYQRANEAISDIRNENASLTTKVAELERRSDANLVRIHEINRRGETENHQRQLDELHEIIREREHDLERAREELRHLKNGRRETRQASVPRSPRPGTGAVGVMSPRPPRGGGVGGAGSRGTSPAPLASATGTLGNETAAAAAANNAANMTAASTPGMAFFSQPTGNGRWGHLRD